MDEEEDDFPQCPLCLEELDATDRAVEACQCGYQVCLWCLHHIREQLNGKCPACRTPYQEQNFKYAQVDPEEAAKEAKERATAKKEKERREKFREIEKERARSAAVSQQKAKNNLKHARILQKNLVYVIGLSLTLAREEVIRRTDMFGKFGRMMRILVNRSHPFNAEAPGGPSISAYVQYIRDSDASAAVRAMNNAVFDGREIRCALATTKYCDSFLRNAAVSDPNAADFCGNQKCMYYHSLCQEGTLTREEVLARQLGPPPPAHLFLPADNRRPQTMQYEHNRIALMPSSPPTRRIIPPRASLLRTAGDGSIAKSDVKRLPRHVSLPAPDISSTFVTRSHSNPSSFRMLHSPVASPQRSGSFDRQGAVPAKSPQQTSPSSPPAKGYRSSGRDRSPYMQGRIPYCNTSTEDVGWTGSPDTRAHMPFQVRLGTLFEAEPNLQLSMPTDFPRKHDLSRLRERKDNNSVRRSMPPRFGEPFASKMSLSQSRPPGFDVAVGSHNNIRRTSERTVAIQETLNQKPNKPPPGFSAKGVGKREYTRENTTDFAMAWSQEASTDEVFSAQTSRSMNQGTIGQFPARIPNDNVGNRSDLANVLAKIGGNLGVSTEFQALGTASTATDSVQYRHKGPVHNFNGSRPFPRAPHNEASHEPHFGRDMTQSSPHHAGNAYPLPRLPMLTAPPPLSHSKYPGGSDTRMSFAPCQGKFAGLLPTGLAFPFRRSRSRFGFARDDPSEEGRVLRGTFTAGALHSITPHSYQQAMMNMENPTADNVSKMGRPSQCTSSGLPSTAAVPGKLDQLPLTTTRQSRSRFAFVDHGSAQMRKSDPSYEPYAVPGTRYATDEYKRIARDVPSDGAISASFATLSTEEKLASLFNSAQRSHKPLPPMPLVDVQQEGIATFAGRDESSDRLGGRRADDIPFCHGRNRKPGCIQNHVQLSIEVQRTHREQIDSAPPGFHEATVKRKSSSIGPLNESMEPAGKESDDIVVTANAVVQNTPKDVNDGETGIVGESRKSRAQKKKEKKARQLKDAVDQEASATSRRIWQSSPVQVGRLTDLAATVKLPQTTQTSNVLLATSTAGVSCRQQVLPRAGSSSQSCRTSNIAVPQLPNEVGEGQHRDADHYVVSGHTSNDAAPCVSMSESQTVVSMSAANKGIVNEEHQSMSVSELEKEVEAARAREAQLQDKLLELQRRIRSYDSVRT